MLPISVIGLIIAVFVLIFLVLRTRVHVLIAMLIAACIAGLIGGLSVDETMSAISKGFGGTLGGIGIVIGLGVMMGAILETSGAGESIAYHFIKWLGKKKEEMALAITGYIVSIPVFVDSALIILYPIAKSLAKKSDRSILTLTVALAGGLVVAHHCIPPTPGPLGVASIFNVDLASMLGFGLLIAIPCVYGIVLYARWLEKHFPEFSVSPTLAADDDLKKIHDDYMASKESKELPSLIKSIMPIVVPIVLILIKSLMSLAEKQFGMEGLSTSVVGVAFNFLGNPIIALSISTLLAVYTLTPYLDKETTTRKLEEGISTCGIILLVTGAGGALGSVLRESGAGAEIANQIVALSISPIMIPFIIATLVRIIQGSGTVSMITAASISAPVLAEMQGVNMLFAASAATMGSLFAGYFNDSLFHIVNRLMGVTEVKKQLVIWTVPTTIAWAIGGSLIMILNLIFGSLGSIYDPVLPLLVLAGCILFVKSQSKPQIKTA
ncbi:MAG: GntP family permease [Gammaproteobacteria bacterium]|uniref:Gluconate transporter n=1 Tax=Marinomonas polaris DSM 16579 TaxID=1122206 RepID=A0A1M5CIX6_9GAMM|nr:SLC13 family permease [Marinomonas polaris]MBU1294711.1 GntP family permease [Gammaproteobacteria bacterium]MBU1465909.1 GntP family permease [Gammaproteobacteria bacterium]MBU2020930.1 GntP family permease [Gammaproteobacteria bacterium]MBU2238575.1 GntP family permease [Gammaproteobacteria bacterium]MBU2318551.1 GntP family permease [Gammaproteobacteria bacterium]